MTEENIDLTNAYVMALAHYHEVNMLFSSIVKEQKNIGVTSGQILNLLKINDLLIRICQKEIAGQPQPAKEVAA